MAGLRLDTRLERVLGASAKHFEKGRGLVTVGDLLGYWPRRYVDYKADLTSLRAGQYAVVVAEVRSAHLIRNRSGKGQRLQVVVTDGRTELELVFFRVYGHKDKLVPGARAVFAGQVGEFRGTYQLAHPEYHLLGADQGHEEGLSQMPIYLQVPKVANWAITQSMRVILDQLDETSLPDALPEDLRQRRRLVTALEAVRGIHRPAHRAEVEAGQDRQRYEEALVLQLVLAQRRWRAAQDETKARMPREGGLLAAFDERLPFELTDGQRTVGATIAEEMSREQPMHRLLQGEVGSGKTIVALRAMLAAVDSGGQAALLAPTEVLAQQHHRSITAMMGDLAEGGMLGGSEIGTKVVLLTGSMSTAAKKRALLDIVTGEAGIVIGTHALIQDTVDFFDLALVVVDEQHRFGVEQRDALRAKGAHPPHVLVMTATPIPRTVAMTVFGDLETSTMRELPRGRAPITTHVVDEAREGWVARIWQRVAEEVAEGRQAYVVCPRIGGDEAPKALDADEVEAPPADIWGEADPGVAQDRPLAGVLETLEELRANPDLQGLRVEMLHGRMAPEDKDAVMARFSRGEIDVLVATTVIEVGVDVPNASVMVIRDADRFGVSQLHQLRGRVGRGGYPGLCLLMTHSEPGPTHDRLDAVAETTDGFELARVDLGQRREGDILGAAQSGRRNQLEFLSILEHEQVIEVAREDAQALVDEDPELTAYPLLAAAVQDRVDAEQAAYLERG
ncbi:ATP-dependent DNA helicase RecG [Actinomycetota bacterium]